jgi:ubiquinone/menaquinone biosynthesis C-methylase UbiE
MFSESAHLYDAIYRAFKDYAAEATAISTLVRAAHPSARTILDVGCGTGEHALHLRKSHGFAVDGLDRDPGLLAVAREKMPDARFFESDMAMFDVGHRYDSVMCLFSSIGYLQTLERVTAALRCFRRHLAEDGVIVVEPWFAPGVLSDGPGSTRRAEAGGVRVERTSHTTVEGRLSTLIFNYRFEDASGVQVAREVHELGLFTQEEMMASFREAGLAATYDSSGLTGRGLYVARIAP